MKKLYMQPIVETESLEISGQALCASPTTGNIDLGGGGSIDPD